jgi:hypothetical protein
LSSVRKIKAVKPAAEIVAEMMAEAREILRAELAAGSEVGAAVPGSAGVEINDNHRGHDVGHLLARDDRQ